MKKSFLFIAAMLFILTSSSAFAVKAKRSSSPHAGFCVLNAAAAQDSNGGSQFLCFVDSAVLNIRCVLSGEGSNIQVGTLKPDGKTLVFEAKENHGNGGQMVCAKE